MDFFLSGMATAGFVIAALFFFRFWKRTKDFLFATFGIAFVLFAAGQAAALWLNLPHNDNPWVYLLRLAGFVLLLIAIARKNVAKPRA
jgi:hypothetical protein